MANNDNKGVKNEEIAFWILKSLNFELNKNASSAQDTQSTVQ